MKAILAIPFAGVNHLPVGPQELPRFVCFNMRDQSITFRQAGEGNPDAEASITLTAELA